MSRRSKRAETAERNDLQASTSPAGEGDRVELAPWDVPGARLRVNARKAKRGFYAPALAGAPSTTRQAEVLNTTVLAAPTGDEGIRIGRDVLTRAAVDHDPITAYERKLLTSPNVCLLGDVGSGKSSACKTIYVMRPLILAGRKVVVFDKKDEQGRGEYSQLVELLGSVPLTFTLDGNGTILNPLDPAITAVLSGGGAFRLVRTLVEHTGGGTSLDRWEAGALRTALRTVLAAAEVEGRQAVLADVYGALPDVVDAPQHRRLLPVARDQLHLASIEVRLALEGLLEEYSGLFDGPTSGGVVLGERLTSFDISQLPPDDPAAAMVMAVANMWLLGQLRRNRGWRTNLIIEEAWDQITGPNGRLVKSNTKLSRGLGLSMIAAIHKPADIPADSPGIAILQEAQTVHISYQSRAQDREACASMFNLGPDAPETIGNLRPGEHLLKIGNRPEIRVGHIRSDLEEQITDTDAAMIGAALNGGLR